MNPDNSSTERSSNLWAPWRMPYIDSLAGKDDGCFLCRYRDDGPANDQKNLVLWRLDRCLVVMNRFPYTGGHSMIAPLAHVGGLADLDSPTMLQMMEVLRDLQIALERALRAQGFNIGINIGRCAGAGLPGHLHIHIVPRWPGDTNFMAVFGQVRVIPQSIEETYAIIRRTSQELGLPTRS